MNKYLFFCLILSATCRLEAVPMRLGEGDVSHPNLEQTQEAQRRDSAVDIENNNSSDQVLRGHDASLGEGRDLELGLSQQDIQNNIISRLQGAAEEVQSALTKLDVSRLFVPSIPERTWSEYFQQSFVEARAHEQAVAILQEVDVTMDQSLRQAHEEAYQAIKQYQDSGPTVVETTRRDQQKVVIKAAQQTAQQLKMAKDPSTYVLYLAEAIAQMLENTKVRDLPQVNEDGTYQDVELRDQWELEQKLVSRLAVPSAVTYTLYGILSEAAEQALLETIFNRISNQSAEGVTTLDELLSDERIAAAADVAIMARLAVVEAESVDFCIAKARGPRAGTWHNDPSRKLLALSRRTVESAQRAHAVMSNASNARRNQFFDPSIQDPLIKEVTDSIMTYRKQNQVEHAQYLKKMQVQGDMCHSDPFFDFECPGKIRRPIQQYYDVALRKQIEARLAGLPLTPSYSGESIIEENQSHQEQLQGMSEMLQNLGMNCPRYRGTENGSENLIRFIFSVSRGTEMPDFSYTEITNYTCRELEAAAANYRETEPASLIRMLLEISIANALPDLIEDVNADIAVKNGKIYAEYERQELHNLCLGVYNLVNSVSQSTHVITTDERSSLSNAVNSIMFGSPPIMSSIMSNTVPVERNWGAIERLQQLLTEKDVTNDSSIDLL